MWISPYVGTLFSHSREIPYVEIILCGDIVFSFKGDHLRCGDIVFSCHNATHKGKQILSPFEKKYIRRESLLPFDMTKYFNDWAVTLSYSITDKLHLTMIIQDHVIPTFHIHTYMYIPY